MPQLYFDRATIVRPTSKQGLTMWGGGQRFFTWHTFQGKNITSVSAVTGARLLNAAGTTPTFCINFSRVEIAQMLPMTVGCYTLQNLPGGVETNRFGTIHAQAEVLANAEEPFTNNLSSSGLQLLEDFLGFLDEWDIPRVWPAGPPLGSYGAPHNRIGPGPSGHYGHSQWREQDHWDPGAINYKLVTTLGVAIAKDPQVVKLQEELVEAGLLKSTQVTGILDTTTKEAKEKYMATLDEMKAELQDVQGTLNEVLTLLKDNMVVRTDIGDKGSDGLTETQRVFGTTSSRISLARTVVGMALAARRTEVVMNYTFPKETARMRQWASGFKPKWDDSVNQSVTL